MSTKLWAKNQFTEKPQFQGNVNKFLYVCLHIYLFI